MHVRQQCREKGFQHFEIAQVMVEDDGAPYTTILCNDCYNLGEGERQEPTTSNKQWKIMLAERRSPGKVSAGLGARGFENKIWECYATKKMFGKRLLEGAAGLVAGE